MQLFGKHGKEAYLKKTLWTAAYAGLLLLSAALSAAAKPGDVTGYIQSGDYVMDGSFAIASGPAKYGSSVGIDVGAGVPLREIDPNLQARLDFSVYYFADTFSWGNASYLRLPVLASLRYYVPLATILRAYAQTGLEVSLDSFDYPLRGRKNSRTEINVGMSPGAGIELFVYPNTSLFALGRYHIIFDSYASMQFGVAMHY